MNLSKSALFFMLLSLPTTLLSAEYYISPSGNDVSGNGSIFNPWASISKGVHSMLSGDTLICKDGLYVGTTNQIVRGNCPPFGTAESWTTIKAEHEGMAVFDGEYARGMCGITNTSLTDIYVQFEGLIWCKSAPGQGNFSLVNCANAKIIRCGAYDSGDGGNTMNFNFSDGHSVLFEGCYAWGDGRYKFLIHESSRAVIRNCVGRLDKVNDNDPTAVFSMYSVIDGDVQNCIAVDSDQNAHYVASEYAGPFAVPSTNAPSRNITFTNCISLNNKINGLVFTEDSHNVIFKNSLMWGTTCYGTSICHNIKSSSTEISNCTFGDEQHNYRWMNFNTTANYNRIRNNIFTGIKDGQLFTWLCANGEDYNAIYNSTGIKLAACDSPNGLNDITTINPIWSISNSSGALKYLPRLEPGSSLEGAGESGADIGANILTLIGSTGTLWGETGYNTDTGISMWPFPNEDLIKEKMNAYSYTDATGTVSGNRGFASTSTTSMDGSPMTLTKYIWEYLGNQIPANIYPVVSTVTATASADPTSGDTPLEVTFSGSAITSSGTITGYAWSFSDGQTSSLQNPTMTFTQSVVATLTATDSNGSVDKDSVSVIVNVPLAPYTVTIQGSFNTTGSYTLH